MVYVRAKKSVCNQVYGYACLLCRFKAISYNPEKKKICKNSLGFIGGGKFYGYSKN
jgi:hypothetical protein